MPPLPVIFSLALLMAAADSLDPSTNQIQSQYEKDRLYQRNLDFGASVIPSVTMIKTDSFGYGIRTNSDDWGVFISSNETILSNGNCPIFATFQCPHPSCSQNSLLPYSQNYPLFSSSTASRLNLTDQSISFADGAWESKSPLLIDDCELRNQGHVNPVIGQIGLGLSGSAFQNFQTQNPIFSIFLESLFTAQLIFGFNETYVNNIESAVSMPCDLDWKIQVEGVTIGDFVLPSSPVSMIFDVQTSIITFPDPYYSSLRSYFFLLESVTGCFDLSKTSSFMCFFHGDIQELPSLVFTLENGTLLTLPPSVYAYKQGLTYAVNFALYKPVSSGVDYILLGRVVMRLYYSVFEKLSNQVPSITLHPLHVREFLEYSELFAGDPPDSPFHSSIVPNTSIKKAFSEKTTTINETSASAPPEEGINVPKTNSSVIQPNESEQPTTTSENEFDSPRNEDSEPSDTILYVVIGIIGLILISIIVVLIGLKKGWLNRKQSVEYQRPTVELNQTSFFESSGRNNNNVVYGQTNEVSD